MRMAEGMINVVKDAQGCGGGGGKICFYSRGPVDTKGRVSVDTATNRKGPLRSEWDG